MCIKNSRMFSKFLGILCVFHFAIISHGLHLYSLSLIKLLNITDLTIDNLGFKSVDPYNKKSRKVNNPFPSYLPGVCTRISNTGKNPSFSSYPKFQNIYSNCQKTFTKDSTCFATCIFYGIIEMEEYGRMFLGILINKENLIWGPIVPFSELIPSEFHLDDNIFCFSKDFRSTLLNNIFTCKLLSSTEFCIIDEEELLCDAHLGNCNFLETEASVITSGNKAHVLTCGTLDTLKWNFFRNSSKLQCILPRKSKLRDMQRQAFNECHVCSSQNKVKNGAVIEFSRSPTREEFSKVDSARPIVVRNGANFDGIAPLNFSILNQIYEDYLVRDWNPCKLNLFYSPFHSFPHALKLITENVIEHWYMVWGICAEEIRNRFGNAVNKPSFLSDDYPRSKDVPWVYASSFGDGVYPHYDYFRGQTWQAQLSGSKTWSLRAPPECSHICTESFEVTVNQGDFFGIRTNTWLHGTSVKTADPSIVIFTDYDLKET